MKKTLIALAAVAATSAFAQSTVTVYGQADAAYTSIKSGTNSFSGLMGAGRGSNFVGFMGSEDLGGGLKANFKIEAGYNVDNGSGSATNTNNQANGTLVTLQGATASATLAGSPATRASINGAQGLTFNRYSHVGLVGGFGEVRLGRDYTSAFNAVLGADTTGANGVQNTLFQTLMIGQANSHANATNASNMIGYQTPNTFGGFGVKAQVFYGENQIGTEAAPTLMKGKSGDGTSIHAFFTQGPFSAGYGTQKTKGTSIVGSSNSVAGSLAAVAAIPGDYQVDAAYAKYDLGVILLTAGQVTEKLATLGTNATASTGVLTAAVAGQLKNASTVFGFSYPVNPMMKINGTYTTSKYTIAGTENAKATQIGLQGMYALSKRTDLYANYAVTDNSVGTAYGVVNGSGRPVAVQGTEAKTTGMQIGMRHNF
jgi:predicted porin